MKIKKKSFSESVSSSSGITRRDFSISLGSAFIAGCADSRQEIIYSHFKDPEHNIPGNSVYYASTCSECKAGCGILAEVREGRVIKIEGNPDDPFARGGTCALGQSAVQGLYDPNRVREPLERVEVKDAYGITRVQFRPISASEALTRVATALKNSNKKFFISTELDYLNQKILDNFCEFLDIELSQFEPFNHYDLQCAFRELWGIDSTPVYDLSNTRLIVSFGAEFLEFWLDPVTFTRQWSFLRKNGLVQHYQFEPRCTLTGSKADKWVSVKPGKEVYAALALLKFIIKLKKGVALPNSILSEISDLDEDELITLAGVEKNILLAIASNLVINQPSVVLGGGIQARKSSKVLLEKVCLLINYCLGNVGKTVLPGGAVFRSNFYSVKKSLEQIRTNGKGATLLIKGNITSWFPPSFPLDDLRSMCQSGLIVYFADILDDTAQFADIILPLNHPLENFSLNIKGNKVFVSQPTMLPLYKTRAFGEYLMILGKSLGAKSVLLNSEKLEEVFTNEFRRLCSTDLSQALEAGVTDLTIQQRVNLTLQNNATLGVKTLLEKRSKLKAIQDLELLPIGSVKAWDGRAHNRAWLLELHDPISLVCWDSWIELSPRTAKKLGLKNRDYVNIITGSGSIECQVVVNNMIRDEAVAVPVGIIPDSNCSFSGLIKKSNAFKLFRDVEKFEVRDFEIKKIPTSRVGYQSQVTKSEEGRELIKVKQLYPNFEEVHHDHHSEHHEAVDLYHQRQHPVFKWGMVVDLAVCTGCSACVVACNAENNIPIVGPRIAAQGRRMNWITIHQYEKPLDGKRFRRVWLPLMCQQCNNAPCEPVCPVYATYHNEEGLNAMIYNRCVGTRYCANNCVYKVRRFNWFEYQFPESLKMQLNPDVTKRGVGVMEKCTFCIQRINEVKYRAKKEGRLPLDGEIKTACQQACPSEAIHFGNLNDPNSQVSRLFNSDRGWKLLDEYVNTKPSVTYLADLVFKV